MTTPGNEWDEYADGWDTDDSARAYASAAFESLRGILAAADIPIDDAKVIDFGCGTGLLTEPLVAAGARVHAIDTSTAMLAVVDRKIAEQGWVDVHAATSLPSALADFDAVACSSVCSFLDDYPATVADLRARLREGGLFVQWDWERTEDNSHGLTRTEMRETLTAAGLVNVTVSDAFTISVDDQVMSPIVGYGQRPHGVMEA